MHPGQNVGNKVFFLDSCAQVSYLEIFLVFTLRFSSLDLYLLSTLKYLMLSPSSRSYFAPGFTLFRISQCLTVSHSVS